MKKSSIDLNQLYVLVTRPYPQGQELSEQIRAAKGRAFYFPTIQIKPEKSSVIAEKLNPLEPFDWLIFLSPAAVTSSVTAITKIPSAVKIAAVGEGTQKLLKKAGFSVDIYPEEDWSTDGLLALSVFQSVKQKKIGLIRGTGGREWLEKKLRERGAEVVEIFSYERLLPTNDNLDECIQLITQHKINCIACTSNQGIENLKKLLGDKMWSFLSSISLMVVSERQKKYALELGFKTIFLAKNASHDAIIETLAMVKDKICQKT